MGVRVNLATDGITGVTGLTTAQVSSDSNLAVNTVVGVVDASPVVDTDYTLTLPQPAAGEDYAGVVIIIKNLRTVGDVIIDTPAGVNIDADATVTVDLAPTGECVSMYYINETIGWLAGPAVYTP